MSKQQKTANGSRRQTASKAQAQKRASSFDILLLFLIAFAVHTFLNMLVNKGPKVVIDEGLYTNIARSLAWKGELAFRGQPINYPYLLYPFTLVPVYWLNRLLGGDVYRYVQVFNTLLITSSVFPAFRFALDFTKDRTKAFKAAAIVALMPDMIFGGMEMAECLLWPLALWMVFFSYRRYEKGTLKDGLLAALFAGLMFAAKPGAIAAGAVLLAGSLLLSLKEKKNVVKTLLSLGALLLIVGIVYGVYLLFFHAQDSILGLYTKQTDEWKSGDVFVAIEATFLLLFLFVFACGGIYGIFPLAHLSAYEKPKRVFILSFVFGVLAVIVGTAVFVVPYKWTGELGNLPLHLRYCAMFIPVMYVFTVDRDDSQRPNIGYAIALIVFVVLSLFPGARAGFVTGKTGVIDSMTLSAFVETRNLRGTATGWILTAFVVCFSPVFLYDAFRKRKPSKEVLRSNLSRMGTIYFVIFILFNALCAHIAANVYIDPNIGADAAEVNRMIGGKDCLGVTQRYYDDIYSYWLDGRINVPMQQVTIDQMFLEMEETGGVYKPFVPVEQSPNVNNHETPDTDTLVLGMTIAEHLELSDTVRAVTTENGFFTVVLIDPSERWVDTMLFGMDDDMLYPDSDGCLRIFSENRSIDGSVVLSVTASGGGVLHVGDRTVETGPETKTYEISVPFANEIAVYAEGSAVRILRYETKKR